MCPVPTLSVQCRQYAAAKLDLDLNMGWDEIYRIFTVRQYGLNEEMTWADIWSVIWKRSCGIPDNASKAALLNQLKEFHPKDDPCKNLVHSTTFESIGLSATQMRKVLPFIECKNHYQEVYALWKWSELGLS